MIWFVLILGVLIGVGLGRWYQSAKMRYPENREILRTREAKARAERAKYEAEEEHYRGKIDDSLEARIGGSVRAHAERILIAVVGVLVVAFTGVMLTYPGVREIVLSTVVFAGFVWTALWVLGQGGYPRR